MTLHDPRMRPFAIACGGMALLWVIHVVWMGVIAWGHECGITTGTVVATWPDDHAMIRSDYYVDGKKYTVQRSGDCNKYGPGDSILVYYWLDVPAASAYNTIAFSLRGLIGQLVIVLLALFLFFRACRFMSYRILLKKEGKLSSKVIVK